MFFRLLINKTIALECVGVALDKLLTPTQEDLASRRDPVLSRAATLVGIKFEPEKVGQMSPAEWRP